MDKMVERVVDGEMVRLIREDAHFAGGYATVIGTHQLVLHEAGVKPPYAWHGRILLPKSPSFTEAYVQFYGPEFWGLVEAMVNLARKFPV